MSKSTGQFRDALRPTADAASLVANKLAMAGVSMKEVTEASLGFLNNLTNNEPNKNMIENGYNINDQKDNPASSQNFGFLKFIN